MPNPVANTGQPQFYRNHQTASFTDSAVKWLNQAKTATKNVVDSLVVKIPLELTRTVSHTISAANDTFEIITKTKPPVALLEAKKIAIIPLFAIPLTLISFIDSLVDFGYAVKSGTTEAMAMAALAATAIFADVVEIPAKIGGVVNLFQPVSQFAVWSSSLYAVSAILSVAGLIFAAFTHEKTREFAKELKDKSQNAVLTEIFTNDRFAPLSKQLKSGVGQQSKKKLDKEFFKALKAVTHCKTPQQLDATMAKLNGELRNLSREDWRMLVEVGDMAYLRCLEDMEKKDAGILSRHFQADGKKISSAIEKIKNCNNPEKKFNAVRILKSRVSYKLLSDKLSIGSNAISIVASVLFVVIAFVTAATPAAPVGYALVIGLTLYGIGKMVADYQLKKQFEKDLDSDVLSPAVTQREPTVRTQPIPLSWW